MKPIYIGADMHRNSTELAIEHNGKIIVCPPCLYDGR